MQTEPWTLLFNADHWFFKISLTILKTKFNTHPKCLGNHFGSHLRARAGGSNRNAHHSVQRDISKALTGIQSAHMFYYNIGFLHLDPGSEPFSIWSCYFTLSCSFETWLFRHLLSKQKHEAYKCFYKCWRSSRNHYVQTKQDQIEAFSHTHTAAPWTMHKEKGVALAYASLFKINVSRWRFPLRGNQATRIFFVALVRVVGISPPATAHRYRYMNPSQNHSCGYTPKLRKISAGFGMNYTIASATAATQKQQQQQQQQQEQEEHEQEQK